MIYTLTLNPAIDKTVVISSFTLNAVNRIQDIRTDVGGKGINVSKCLTALGEPSTAVAFWGGTEGARGVKFLEESGIVSVAIPVAGETRTNLKVVVPVQKQNTDINEPGPVVSSEEMNELIKQLDMRITCGDLLILSGSIPRGIPASVYRDLILRYQAKGAKVFLDADGVSFQEGIAAAPYLVKPNIDELRSFCGRSLSNREEIVEEARKLLEKGIQEVVVSMGAEGAMLIQPERAYYAPGLKVQVKSTVGAGDSMVAALAYGVQKGMTASERLALAVSISAACVMCSGTQIPDSSVVREFVSQVRIEEAC